MLFNFVNMFASKQFNIVAKNTVIHHIIKRANTVMRSHHKIFGAVVRGCVHTACARISSDMVSQ